MEENNYLKIYEFEFYLGLLIKIIIENESN